MAWWGVCSALFYIFLAATLAVAYGTLNTIIGMVLTVISYGLINTVLSRYALKTGLSVSLFSRVLFGKAGALLATAIFFLTAIYYAVFEGSVIAVAASTVIGGLSYGTAAILVVAYSVPLVFGSVQHFLDKLNGVLLPLYVIGLFASVIATIVTYGYSNNWLTYAPEGGAPGDGWVSVYIAYMGVYVLMMFTFDYARFGASKDVEYHARINFGIPFYLLTFLINGLVGIFLITSGKVATVSETGVVDQLIVVLGGFVALVFIWATQTRINSANYYLATVNMQAFFDKLGLRLRKSIWAVIVGVVVLIMMRATDVFSYILTALNYQGIFVTAWVGIAVTHILSRGYEKMFGDRVYYHSRRGPELQPGGTHRLAGGRRHRAADDADRRRRGLRARGHRGPLRGDLRRPAARRQAQLVRRHRRRPRSADHDLSLASGVPPELVSDLWSNHREAGTFAPHPPSRRT